MPCVEILFTIIATIASPLSKKILPRFFEIFLAQTVRHMRYEAHWLYSGSETIQVTVTAGLKMISRSVVCIGWGVSRGFIFHLFSLKFFTQHTVGLKRTLFIEFISQF
jgi:hypothetical protein